MGPQTHKGQLNQDQANAMMNHLKASHFILGKDNSGFSHRSSTNVGKFAQTARMSENPPWATLKTHFGLGVDQENKTSDYAMRYQEKTSNPNQVNGKMHTDNKTKIELDSTILGIPGASIAKDTTTADNTQDKHESAKAVNSPLPSFIANNIRTTHFEIGPGGKARPTETHEKFGERDAKGAKFELAPERIEFFK